MAEEELEALRRRKLLEMQKKVMARREVGPSGEQGIDKDSTLKRVLVGRAWEVLQAARNQYPDVMPKVEEAIAKLVTDGRFTGQIGGEELYAFLRYLGLRVRLETRIRVLESGELKTLADKLRES